MSILPHSVSPVLHVADLNAAIKFYIAVLGCSENFRFEGNYAGIKLGNVNLHIAQGGGTVQSSGWRFKHLLLPQFTGRCRRVLCQYRGERR